MTEVRVSAQVARFCAELPPEPKKKLRAAIRGLAEDRGNLKTLEGRLTGYARLRCGPYRVIIKYVSSGGRRTADCVFVEHRSIVYEILLSTLGSHD